jgi:polysaccharide biosynthesis transport protein
MELKDYINVLWRRKWVILLTLTITMTVVMIGTQMMTPVYRASTTLRIAASASGSLNYSDYMYAERLMNTYVEIATSRPVLEELLKRLDLIQPPNIKAEIVPNTELIRITVEDISANRTALAANTLTEILITQSSQLYTGGGKKLTEVLGEQLAVIQADVEKTQQDYEKLLIQTPAASEKIDASGQLLQLKQSNYATLLGQYQQARFREEVQASMITIFETAIVPQTPSKPRVLLNISLGLVVGLVGGLGLAFIFENLDTTLYTTEDIEIVTKITALAKIPKVNKKQTCNFQDVFSPIAEAFRKLATNIQLANHQESRKVLLIVSAEPNQGKSMIVANLAFSLAELGKNVVAIDCDTRMPTLHSMFHLSNQCGLKDVLEQKTSVKKALQKSSYDGVTVLSSGSLLAHPSQLLGSPQMAKLIESLRQQFDYILLDSPALLAVADVSALTPNADGLIFVVRRAHATREAVQTAGKYLAELHDKSFYLIVNQADHSNGYDYYQYRRKSGTFKARFKGIFNRRKSGILKAWFEGIINRSKSGALRARFEGIFNRNK